MFVGLFVCLLFFYSSWYLKAQHIAPKNGRPYNQLALLAVYTVRNLVDRGSFIGSVLEIQILIASAPGIRFHLNTNSKNIVSCLPTSDSFCYCYFHR